jgi:hypothetical protein
MMRSWLVLGGLLLTGCSLYFGGDDQPPPCEGDYAGPNIPAQLLRDPQTGQCETWSYGCDPSYQCGCAPIEEPAPAWPMCGGTCDSLGEVDCVNTAGCHADYTGTACPPNADCTGLVGITFWTCSGIEQPPAEGGDCWSLGADACLEHDDCATTYTPGTDGTATSFNQCIPEPANVGACSAVTCAPGTHCETQCAHCNDPTKACPQYCVAECVADSDCSTVLCGPNQVCEEVCSGPVCDPPGPCPQTCQPTCVAASTDPGQCTGTITCNGAPPKCPQNTTAGIANGCWTGYCIPNAACGNPDPGVCNGPVTCQIAQPACPAGTEPGALNGCWTGYCIPDADCGPTTCGSITDEKSCVARTDCEAVYNGTGCTCDANGCTCTTETFARCESAGKL